MIKQIPEGNVATYGQIASLAGIPKNSRQVGTVLKALPANSGVPWFRVVNSKGEISQRKDENSESNQKMLLEDEGIEFSSRDRIPLKSYQWDPS